MSSALGWFLAVTVLALAVAAGLRYMTAMPGRSHAGPLPPLSHDASLLAERLRRHVAELAKSERNSDLETPARYIEKALGAKAQSQYFESGGRRVRNIEVGSGAIVVGAHYDTVPDSPGADDNASGVAVLLELAGMLAGEGLPIRFVAFANEERPYFLTEEMGSPAWAKRAHGPAEPVRAMFALEMLGYCRVAPESQS